MKLVACALAITGVSGLFFIKESVAAQPLIDQTVQARWPMIQRCYESQLRKGAVGDGKIVVGFETTTRGSVKKAWIQESTIDNEVVKRCVVFRFKKLRFQLSDQKVLRGFYPIVFTAKSASTHVHTHPLSNKQAKTMIDQAVQEKWPKFQKCYLKEKIRGNAINPGTISLSFVMNENGKVSHTTIHQSDVNNKDIEQCIVDLFRAIRVEKPLHRIVQGMYPITFK